MAKKILAVVLAVTIALSAMAITAFADYEVPLFSSASDWSNRGGSKKSSYQVTFDIPVYGMYGYLNAGDRIEIDLPINWGPDVSATSAKWSISVDGMLYSLNSTPVKNTNGSEVQTAVIYFSYLPHSFNGTDTAIPQSTSFNQWSSIHLVCEMAMDGDKDIPVGIFAAKNGGNYYDTEMQARWYKQGEDKPLDGSVSYACNWIINANKDTNPVPAAYDFVTDEWSTDASNSSRVPFTWDHTLENRKNIREAAENGYTVQLVVPLTTNLVGQATYTLYANRNNSTYYADSTFQYNLGNWWQYKDQRTFVDDYPLDGTASELVFDVPATLLYDKLYGTFNYEFVIFEDITLFNSTVMKDYLTVDGSKVPGGSGSLGRLSWPEHGYNADPTPAYFDNAKVNYARSGKAGRGLVSGSVPFPEANVKKDANGNATKVATKTFDVATGVWDWTAVFESGGFGVGIDGIAETDRIVVTGVPSGVKLSLQGAGVEGRVELIPGTNCTQTSDGSLIISGKDYLAAAGGAWAHIVQYNTAIPAGTTIKTYLFDSSADLTGCGEAAYTGADMGNINGTRYAQATVQATAGVKLVIKTPEAAEEVGGETIDTPTDTTEQQGDDEGDDTVNLGDTEEPAKEENPKTGVALAVLPMLVAAAAAVASKKH